jgi:hypothetical protein
MCTPISAATQSPSATGLEAAERREMIRVRIWVFYQELQVALDTPEIYVLGLLSRHGEVEIVWHVGSRERSVIDLNDCVR